MKIGELLIAVGLSGVSDVTKGLGQVSKGTTEAGKSAWSMRTKVLLAVYAMKEFMNFGMQTGTNLNKFATVTDMSAESLQRWQHAARQVGTTNESVQGSFEGLQKALMDQKLGMSSIGGFSRVAEVVNLDVDRAYQDAEYMMSKLQEFAGKSKLSKMETASIIGTFGIDKDMIQALMKGAFTKKSMSGANLLSDGESKKLLETQVAWANLENDFKVGISKLFASGGGDIVKSITEMSQAFLSLLNALRMVNDQFEVTKNISKGISWVFDGVSSGLKAFKQIGGNIMKNAGGLDDKTIDIEGKKLFESMKARQSSMMNSIKPSINQSQSGGQVSNEININQTIGEGVSPLDVKNSTVEAFDEVAKTYFGFSQETFSSGPALRGAQ